MRYFLTGATGSVGGRVARQLREARHQVVALVRSAHKAHALRELGVEIAQGDITDKKSMRAAMEGADGVFHIAAWYKIGAKNRSDAQRINVEGTRNVLQLMKELGVPKGVYTSTVAVFSNTHGRLVDESYRYTGPHLTTYDRTKWAAHYEVALPMIVQGLPLVIVLPGAVYGPDDSSLLGQSLNLYLRAKLPMVPKDTAVCWSHVDDTARGHLLAMEKGRAGESYILTGPCHTIEQALAILDRTTGTRPRVLHVSSAFFKALIPLIQLAAAIIKLPEIYSAEAIRIIAGVTYLGCNEKARRELGFDPRTLEQGFREIYGR